MLWQRASRLLMTSSSTGFIRMSWRISPMFMVRNLPFPPSGRQTRLVSGRQTRLAPGGRPGSLRVADPARSGWQTRLAPGGRPGSLRVADPARSGWQTRLAPGGRPGSLRVADLARSGWQTRLAPGWQTRLAPGRQTRLAPGRQTRLAPGGSPAPSRGDPRGDRAAWLLGLSRSGILRDGFHDPAGWAALALPRCAVWDALESGKPLVGADFLCFFSGLGSGSPGNCRTLSVGSN